MIIILAAAEFVAYLDFIGTQISQGDSPDFPYQFKPRPFEQIYEESRQFGFGKIYGENKKGKPVVLCISSDAFGEGVEEKDTLGKRVSDEYNVPVYLRSFSGWGMQNMYWQFSRDDFYKEVPEPQAVIVVYNPYLNRFTYAPEAYNTLRYDIKNGEITRVSNAYMFMNYSYAILKFRKIIGKIKADDIQNTLGEFNIFLLESKKFSQKHWKNTKFIVVKNTDKSTKDDPMSWEVLKKQDVSIIELSDFLGDDYTSKSRFSKSENDRHPNKRIWKKASSALGKYLIKGQS